MGTTVILLRKVVTIVDNSSAVSDFARNSTKNAAICNGLILGSSSAVSACSQAIGFKFSPRINVSIHVLSIILHLTRGMANRNKGLQ